MTSSTIPLVTVAEIEAYAAVTNTGGASAAIETVYTDLSRLATTQIEKYCRLTLLRENKTEYFPTKSTSLIGLNLYGTDDTVTVSSARQQKIYLNKINIDAEEDFLVYYDTSRQWGASTLIDASYYVVDYVNGSLITEFPTDASMRALKVVYTGGFASAGSPATLSASAPDDLKMACISQVIFMYNALSAQDIGTELREKTNRMYQRPGFMTDNAMQLIQPYKRFYTGRYA
jgi:hypothetical protein